MEPAVPWNYDRVDKYGCSTNKSSPRRGRDTCSTVPPPLSPGVCLLSHRRRQDERDETTEKVMLTRRGRQTLGRVQAPVLILQ